MNMTVDICGDGTSSQPSRCPSLSASTENHIGGPPNGYLPGTVIEPNLLNQPDVIPQHADPRIPNHCSIQIDAEVHKPPNDNTEASIKTHDLNSNSCMNIVNMENNGVYKDSANAFPGLESTKIPNGSPPHILKPATDQPDSEEKNTLLEKESPLDDDDPMNIDAPHIDTPCTMKHTVLVIVKVLCIFLCLYCFICSLDLMSSAFQLLGGKAAGRAFRDNKLLRNPICGLMLGVVATAVLQSSSTSTSIVTTMVASGLLTVPVAIPIIMGANIGTSVTGVIVAVAQAGNRKQFKRAFSAATVHDTFNWLTVILLLPIEVGTGYLYHLTTLIVNRTMLAGGGSKQEFLKVLTKPLTKRVVQLNKKVLAQIAEGDPGALKLSLLKEWCKTKKVLVSVEELNVTMATTQSSVIERYDSNTTGVHIKGEIEPVPEVLPTDITGNLSFLNTTTAPQYKTVGIEKCSYWFMGSGLQDQAVGGILLVVSLTLLLVFLTIMVKLLRSLLGGPVASALRRAINADFPGCCKYFTGYFTILVGAVLTILVQSSSVVVSTLTPLVGIGLVEIERVYPMMLGANLGTTSTAILAAFAASGSKVKVSLQIALCHMFFNLTGILIWYPLEKLRNVPISWARFLGKTTSQYRWFAFIYLISMFFLIPLFIFGLSLLGTIPMACILVPVLLAVAFIGIINLLQRKKPNWLPKILRNWEFLPEFMRSLEPYDRQLVKLACLCRCCRFCRQVHENGTSSPQKSLLRSETQSDTESLKLSKTSSQVPLKQAEVITKV